MLTGYYPTRSATLCLRLNRYQFFDFRGGDEKWLDSRSVSSQEEFLMNVLYERKRGVRNGSEIVACAGGRTEG